MTAGLSCESAQDFFTCNASTDFPSGLRLGFQGSNSLHVNQLNLSLPKHQDNVQDLQLPPFFIVFNWKKKGSIWPTVVAIKRMASLSYPQGGVYPSTTTSGQSLIQG
jgi:hypothetical protein